MTGERTPCMNAITALLRVDDLSRADDVGRRNLGLVDRVPPCDA